MHYVVGLGNPGEKYERTRHNVGWLALDRLISDLNFPQPVDSKKVSGRISEGEINGRPVAVLYPDTYMNHSGTAVRKLLGDEPSENLIVVYDDVDLPLGQIKISFGRGSGGHNGVESILNSLNTKDFARIRIGIAKTGFWPWEKGIAKRPAGGEALQRHVLGQFTKREQSDLDDGLRLAAEAIKMIVIEGQTKAMNQFN